MDASCPKQRWLLLAGLGAGFAFAVTRAWSRRHCSLGDTQPSKRALSVHATSVRTAPPHPGATTSVARALHVTVNQMEALDQAFNKLLPAAAQTLGSRF